MATIEDVHLEIIDALPHAVARVSYKLKGDAEDREQKRSYAEVVEILGVDQDEGEDGKDDLIAGARFEGIATFPGTAPNRRRDIPLRNTDEDPGLHIPIPLPIRDEFQARVTLRRISTTRVRETSNVVVRGGIQ